MSRVRWNIFEYLETDLMNVIIINIEAIINIFFYINWGLELCI